MVEVENSTDIVGVQMFRNWLGVNAWTWGFGNTLAKLQPLSRLLSGPAAGMTPEEEADQVLRQVVGGPQGREKQRSFGAIVSAI